MNPSNTPADELQKVPFQNEAGMSIPPCAVMSIVGSTTVDGVAFVRCVQPGAAFGTQYAVNGPVRVPPGEQGVCYRRGEVPAAYDVGSPQPGQCWGPKPGQWTLSYANPGWTIVDIVDATNRIALVNLD
jgi:hypothetical protein